eukprot:4502009-Prymnesium_polylepis.1
MCVVSCVKGLRGCGTRTWHACETVCVLRAYGAADANRERVRGRANDAHSVCYGSTGRRTRTGHACGDSTQTTHTVPRAIVYVFRQHIMPARTGARLQA